MCEALSGRLAFLVRGGIEFPNLSQLFWGSRNADHLLRIVALFYRCCLDFDKVLDEFKIESEKPNRGFGIGMQ